MIRRQRIKTFEASLSWRDLEYNCSLPQFLTKIEETVRRMPPEERSNITVEWTEDSIEFQHYRDETDEELARREDVEKQQFHRKFEVEELGRRALYEELKRRYEPQ